MIAAWYRDHGYNFLALSDHNLLSDSERWITVEKGAALGMAGYLKRFGEEWVERRMKEETPKPAPSVPGASAAAPETPAAPRQVQQVRLKKLSEFRTKLEEADRFLMIQSEEITGRFLSAPIHINATNLREKVAPQTGSSVLDVMQKTVDAVAAQRKRTGVPMFTHINHPNYGWAITAEDLMQLDREQFFEIYNGHPEVRTLGDATHAGMDRVWDIILTQRLAVLGKEAFYGMANDDSHQYHNEPKKLSHPGRGWVMVRAAKLTPEDLIEAMEAGDFYASTGVVLSDVQRSATRLRLQIEEFVGTRLGFSKESEPIMAANGAPLRATRKYSDEVGAVLATSADLAPAYEFKGDEIYVRARIVSSKLKADPVTAGEFEQAWTQPVVGRRK